MRTDKISEKENKMITIKDAVNMWIIKTDQKDF